MQEQDLMLETQLQQRMTQCLEAMREQVLMQVVLQARMVLLRIRGQLAEVQEGDTQVQALEVALHPQGDPVGVPRQ